MSGGEPGTVNQIRLTILHSEEVVDRPPRSGEGSGGGDPALEPAFCSDDMLAAELSKSLGEDWRCAAETGEWWRWTGQRWEVDKTRVVFRRSRQVCRGVGQTVDSAKLKRDVSSKTHIYAAVKLAGEDGPHVISIDQFDRDGWLLNMPSGIMDVTTGQCREHDRAAMMTRMTKAGADGDCPKFRAFLAEATGGDADLMRFLQRVAGYCLTGSIEEHAIFFLYGPGGTGKTVFLNVLSDLLGDYATVAPMDIFTVSTGERHPAELAILHRARLVTASETEEGRRWDEAKLKAITGGDRITARFMRGNFFSFTPNFKLLMAGNHRPRMRSADDAMRRRFHVIPFKVKPQRVNKDLLAELQAELGGVLKWAIEGEFQRRRIGLAPPRVVVEETDEYFQAENTIGRWIDERCCTGPRGGTCCRAPNTKVDQRCHQAREAHSATKDLYRDFKSWAADAGEFVIPERVFRTKLGNIPGLERGRHKATDARGFFGIVLLSQSPELFTKPHTTLSARGGEGAKHHEPAGGEPWRLDPGEDFER